MSASGPVRALMQLEGAETMITIDDIWDAIQAVQEGSGSPRDQALCILAQMLIELAEDDTIPFEEALEQFSRSYTCKALLNPLTGIYREDAVYLRILFEGEQKKKEN